MQNQRNQQQHQQKSMQELLQDQEGRVQQMLQEQENRLKEMFTTEISALTASISVLMQVSHRVNLSQCLQDMAARFTMDCATAYQRKLAQAGIASLRYLFPNSGCCWLTV